MATVAELFNLASKHYQSGAFAQAEHVYRQILRAASNHSEATRLIPVCAQAHFNLGVVMLGQGRLEDAIGHYRQALLFDPESVEAHNNLANALRHLGRLEEALSSYQQALRCRPDCAETYTNLGTTLIDLGRVDKALSCFQAALQINPKSPEAHNNLGEAFKRLGQLHEALASYHEALRIDPNFAEGHNSLGDALKHSGQFDRTLALCALGCFEKALQQKPDFAGAHWNRALMWLLLGDFERGWPEYEWRWTQPAFVRRHTSRPLWDGSPLNGRTLQLHTEQGYGDTLQFIRYVEKASHQRKLAGNGKVIVECQPSLVRLLSGVAGIDQVLPHGSVLPQFDIQAPLGSLPSIFHTSLKNVPVPVPYLQANPDLVDHWRRELHRFEDPRRSIGSEFNRHSSPSTNHQSQSRLTIGIAWQGNPAYGLDRRRSIPLKHFARLAQVERIQLISLQKGPGEEQLQRKCEVRNSECAGEKTAEFAVRAPELDVAAGPFMDTAAVMKNLDLVISSDTSIPHLAGALGVPVWVALPVAPDWRWLLEREDCPWYPSMRLFRQSRYDQWGDVFERMAEELTALLSAKQESEPDA
jgi:tetratricopeptide (TPR) repeat protein